MFFFWEETKNVVRKVGQKKLKELWGQKYDTSYHGYINCSKRLVYEKVNVNWNPFKWQR